MSVDQKETHVAERKREEFAELFDEFIEWWVGTAEGQGHLVGYDESRKQARENYQLITGAAGRGDDVTEEVLLKFVPYTDKPSNREMGAWINMAPVFATHVRRKFEGAGWVEPEDWPHVAGAILDLVRRCTNDPQQLEPACEEFTNSPYSKGFQAGTLSPILNALRPEDFIIVNRKPLSVINYFSGTSYSADLSDYPATNAAGRALIRSFGDVMHRSDVPQMLDPDLFDTFSHWLVAVKKFDFRPPRYWKIAPGEGAWNWDACRQGGFIAVGWDELGDVSGVSRGEFNARRDELVAKHDDWTKTGLDQVWTLSHTVKEGDRIVANRGTTEVLGIGTVIGPYYFEERERHGHKLPVQWEDLAPRRVDEYGWRRTLVELDEAKFGDIVAAPLIDQPPVAGAAFTSGTFELLAALHGNPARDYYLAHKDEFRTQLEGPFKELFRNVAARLPPDITAVMETEKNIFSRIPKNDFGRGGAWDFYWGAFYPKGGKRTEDAQLFMWINRDRLEYGFYIGEYGSEHRARFLTNCRRNRDILVRDLEDPLADTGMVYGPREDFVGGEGQVDLTHSGPSLDQWLLDPSEAGIHAAVILTRHEVLEQSAGELAEAVADVYGRLFPLVLLAASDDPMPMIGDYVDGLPPEPLPLNPVYSLDDCAQDTYLDAAVLQRWVRAIDRKGQAILYGPPGTGKTYLAEHLARHLVAGGDGFDDLVQFHPAYAYEDFIQGIRPKATGDGHLDYPIVPGRFLEFCDQAEGRQDPCVLIIDEINRANLARVFGELMYLLEYRDREVPLAAGRTLRIPSNVRIIGTMNTADRSIALVDHALRRRFAFLALYPNYDILRRYHESTGFDVEPLINVLRKLNTEIGDRHYEVGITFFLREDVDQQIEDVWAMEIEPYLEEYFFDQPDKVEQFRWKKVGDEILS